MFETKIDKLEPAQDRVFVLPDDPIKETAGGVILPDTAEKDQNRTTGTIVAIGPGRYDRGFLNPTTFKKDDHVLYSHFTGTVVEVEGKKLLLMREDDIFSKV